METTFPGTNRVAFSRSLARERLAVKPARLACPGAACGNPVGRLKEKGPGGRAGASRGWRGRPGKKRCGEEKVSERFCSCGSGGDPAAGTGKSGDAGPPSG